ncbi:DL-endopeptidase inhibitor IseA family protein [Haloimpatiens sp. FM7330]|uniref:DL-endopeptidase inhibitor IseA family protein n=1 Tax=Haloimpatiens sp. FM7330 TaxID=3298610 RepID=UPI0036278E3E
MFKFKKAPLLCLVISILLIFPTGCKNLEANKKTLPTNKTNKNTKVMCNSPNSNNKKSSSTSSNLDDNKATKSNVLNSTTKTTSTNIKNSNLNKNNKITAITDKQIIELLYNGYNTMRSLEKFLQLDNPMIEDSSYTYVKLPQKITTNDALVQYLNKELNINKYYTNDYMKRLINYSFNKKFNGEYYMLIGQFGMIENIKNAKVTDKKYENNKLHVTISVYDKYEKKNYNHNASLIYNGKTWLIDTVTFSPW